MSFDATVAVAPWALGVGALVVLMVVPVLVIAVVVVVAKRASPHAPDPSALGSRLAGIPATLTAATQNFGGSGLRQGGVRGTAVVQHAVDTTSQVNRQPVIDLVLDVARPDGSTTRIQHRSVVPNTALHRLAPGSLVVVYHDPADLGRLLVAWDEPPPPTGPLPGFGG